MHLESIIQQVLDGTPVDKEQALFLVTVPLEPLCEGAEKIRRHFCGNVFDVCAIVNARSGRCPEDCKFCAQSVYYVTPVQEYPLLSEEKILEQARLCARAGIHRFSIVISGRSVESKELERICKIIRGIKKETELYVCASLGILEESQYRSLREAGLDRIHNNLETAPRFFPFVCSTHTYEEKVNAIRLAQRFGFSVCSGGIFGLGETMEDRIDMAFVLRELGISSVPLNLLDPIPGTPYEKQPLLSEKEFQRIVAIFRYILPQAYLRLAGGRRLLSDKGAACFRSGANATISGNLLTTSGIPFVEDRRMLHELGFQL